MVKQTIALNCAVHNELFDGNVGFAIQLQTFITAIVNGNLGSIPVI
jgi:hypothetical protein